MVSNVSAELVVSKLLPSSAPVPAGLVATRPSYQPTTTAAVAPTPTATKNSRIAPATYIEYLNGAKALLATRSYVNEVN